MHGLRQRACRVAVLGLAFLAGCALTRKPATHPEDPLLLAKKPAEGKVAQPAHRLQVRSEPPVPPVPRAVVAAPLPPPPHALQAERLPTPRPVSTTEATAPNRAPVRANLVARRRAAGTHGHADDASWLQGELAQGQGGTFQLRYQATSDEGSRPGVVTLEEDARLRAFRPGDIVLVEGERMPSEGSPNPKRYHIHSIWLVRRGGL